MSDDFFYNCMRMWFDNFNGKGWLCFWNFAYIDEYLSYFLFCKKRKSYDLFLYDEPLKMAESDYLDISENIKNKK